MKQPYVATLFPVFCKLKSLCRGELIDWYELGDIILHCSSIYHLLLGLIVYLWTTNSCFQGFLHCWLRQQSKAMSKALPLRLVLKGSQNYRKFVWQINWIFCHAAGMLNWMQAWQLHTVFSTPALWEGQIIKQHCRAKPAALCSAVLI